MTELQIRDLLLCQSHVTVTGAEDGIEVRISGKAEERSLAGLLWTMPVLAILMIVGGIAMFRAGMVRGPILLSVWGAMLFAAMLILMLVRLATGPAKDQVIRLKPGAITVDRYIQGDHVVRHFTPTEVICTFAESGMASVSTRIGETAIATSLKDDAAVAMADLGAQYLWRRELAEYEQPLAYGIKRRIFVPRDTSADVPLGKPPLV